MNSKRIIGQYRILNLLGEGSSAKVYRGKHLNLGYYVAIKKIPCSYFELSEGHRKFMESELEAMKRVDHPNIVALYEVINDGENLYIITELADGGSIADRMRCVGLNNYSEEKKLFKQIALAVDYLQNTVGIIHRDIKMENILLDFSGRIKLADFGLSKIIQGDALTSTPCGSPAYVAPEVIVREPYGKAADVWSIGICLFSLVTGYLPFYGDSIVQIMHKIVTEDIIIPTALPTDLQDLLKGMLQKDPCQRISIKDVLNHPWLKDVNFETSYSPDSFQNYDQGILKTLDEYGFDKQKIVESLDKGLFDEFAAPYRITKRLTLSRIKSLSNSYHIVSQKSKPQFELSDRKSIVLAGLLCGNKLEKGRILQSKGRARIPIRPKLISKSPFEIF